MKTIKLYGKLGATFGREFKLDVKTPAEAIRALAAILPGFRGFMNRSSQDGMMFAVFSGSTNISERELHNLAEPIIKIAPVTGGRKSGFFQVVFGAILMAASFFVPGGPASPWGAALFNIGASLAIGGVIQMLSPQTLGATDSSNDDNRANYAFGGAVNTTAQGNPVPVLYGMREVGGAVVSASIYTEDTD